MMRRTGSLDAAALRRMRNALAASVPVGEIARRFGTSHEQVCRLIDTHGWAAPSRLAHSTRGALAAASREEAGATAGPVAADDVSPRIDGAGAASPATPAMPAPAEPAMARAVRRSAARAGRLGRDDPDDLALNPFALAPSYGALLQEEREEAAARERALYGELLADMRFLRQRAFFVHAEPGGFRLGNRLVDGAELRRVAGRERRLLGRT